MISSCVAFRKLVAISNESLGHHFGLSNIRII